MKGDDATHPEFFLNRNGGYAEPRGHRVTIIHSDMITRSPK